MKVVEYQLKQCGLPPITALPRELFDMIYDSCKDNVFWRFCRANQVAKCISRSSPSTLKTFPLQNVLAWEREGELALTGSSSSSSERPVQPGDIFRLSVDWHGLKKIERLASWPAYEAAYSQHHAFALETAESVKDVVVEVKVSLPSFMPG